MIIIIIHLFHVISDPIHVQLNGRTKNMYSALSIPPQLCFKFALMDCIDIWKKSNASALYYMEEDQILIWFSGTDSSIYISRIPVLYPVKAAS